MKQVKLNNEQIELLERLGATFFSIRQCAVVLELSEYGLKALLEDRNSIAYKSYYKGKFTSELKIREGIISLAERGSNPAQQMIQKIIESTDLSNL